jgi:hypothetical protein
MFAQIYTPHRAPPRPGLRLKKKKLVSIFPPAVAIAALQAAYLLFSLISK